MKCTYILDGQEAKLVGTDNVSDYAIYEVDGPLNAPPPRESVEPLDPARCAKMCKAWHERIPDDRLKQLCDTLGLSATALMAFGVGWVSLDGLEKLKTKCYGPGCWTFPMVGVNDSGKIECVGIRLRSVDGHKYCVSGSDPDGVFIPRDPAKAEYVLIVEGPSDAASAYQLGFPVIGRPNNLAGWKDAASIAVKWGVKHAVIIPDSDSNERAADQTEKGTMMIAGAMAIRGITPHIMKPSGTKDLREYVNRGGKRAAIEKKIRELVGGA